MVVIAGIDEAGYGPVLGPMVVSASAFSVPDESVEVSMWRLLTGAVARKRSRRSSAVVIADSKKLYSGLRGAGGLAGLERGVLSMLAARGAALESLGQLLEVVCPPARKHMSLYPWYAGGDVPLPVGLSAGEVRLSGNSLLRRMTAVGVAPLGMHSEVVLEGEYNRLVGATRNKSAVLLDVTCRLLQKLWLEAPDGRLRIYVDRQGGRMRYLPALQRLFEGCRFKIIDETDSASGYRVTDGDRRAELYFLTGGEKHQLPVALASMLSKYVRELFMVMFNRFWAKHVPDIAPTAGYYTDGNRFYREIVPAVRRLGLDENQLYRTR